MTCTKKEIIKEVAARTGFDLVSVRTVVQTMLDTMCEGLAEDSNIEIRNFGVFKVKRKPSCLARNPRTAETIRVPEKRLIHFKPGQEMRRRINEAPPATDTKPDTTAPVAL